MDMNNLAAWITNWEGRKNQAYTDSEGYRTVGIGFNLDAGGAQAAIEALGLDYNQVRSGAQVLTDAQVDALFQQSVNTAVQGASGPGGPITNFDGVPDDRQIVIVDMIFNLGLTGFSAFKMTIRAINSQDWATAAQQMQQSAWYNQVKNRAKANVAVMAGQTTVVEFLQSL